jgi:hypothetical protein
MSAWANWQHPIAKSPNGSCLGIQVLLGNLQRYSFLFLLDFNNRSMVRRRR